MRSLPVILVIFGILFSVASCAAPQRHQVQAVVPPNPWDMPQYEEHSLESERAIVDFTDQLARACYAEVYRLNPRGLPAGLTPTTAIETCARAKLFHVFDDPVGEKACRNQSDLDALSRCLMTGAVFNHLRVNVGSPTLLTEAEWQDTDLAKDNLASEMMAQAYVQCASGDSAMIEQCQFHAIYNSVGIAQKDIDYCMTRENYAASCFVDKGVAKFIRDASTRLWD